MERRETHFFKSSLKDMFMILEKERQGERESERETSIGERNMDWLLPGHIPTGDTTHNLDMFP